MSAVPAAVQQQLDRANQLAAQAQSPQAPAPTDTPSGLHDPNAPPSTDTGVNWEQRYRSLQGKYDAEVPRLVQATKAQSASMAELEAKLSRATSDAEEAKRAAAQQQYDAELEGLKEDYDPDSVVSVIANQREQIATLQQQLATITGDVSHLKSTEETRAENVAEQLIDLVKGSVPNLEQINRDPAFGEWEVQVDEDAALVSGVRRTRQQIFQEIVANVTPENLQLSAKRAIALYQRWERDKGASAHQPLLTPMDTASVTVPTNADNRWGPKSAAAFYRDRQRGVFRGRDKEAAELDASLTSSQNEGRWDPRL